MKVTVAMATYNGAQYLKEQLQSFADQTRQPDELIVTDDCSTDKTEAIVREFAESAPFKVEFYCNEKRLGYSGNFNSALMKSTGDLVFLSDQDDVWFPEKIEHIMGVAERNSSALLLMNDAALTNGALKQLGLTKMGQIRSAGLNINNFVMGCCCAVRHELLNLCLPISVGFKSHDNWLAWFAEGLNAKVIDETVLQYYRRHESNESQFIANKTIKVTRAQVFMYSIKSIFQRDAGRHLKTQLEQLKIFTDSVHEVYLKSPEIYLSKLALLENEFRLRVIATENRIAVRERWLLSRILAAVVLYVRGGYRYTNGLKSVLRDIVG